NMRNLRRYFYKAFEVGGIALDDSSSEIPVTSATMLIYSRFIEILAQARTSHLTNYLNLIFPEFSEERWQKIRNTSMNLRALRTLFFQKAPREMLQELAQSAASDPAGQDIMFQQDVERLGDPRYLPVGLLAAEGVLAPEQERMGSYYEAGKFFNPVVN